MRNKNIFYFSRTFQCHEIKPNIYGTHDEVELGVNGR